MLHVCVSYLCYCYFYTPLTNWLVFLLVFLDFSSDFFLGRSSLLLSYCLTYGYPTFLHPSKPRLQMPLTWSVSECCFMEVNGWGCFCYFRQQPRILPLFSNIFFIKFLFFLLFSIFNLKVFFSFFFLNQCAGNK